MIIVFLKRLMQMLGLLALQVLVCNHIRFMGYATPMPYVLFIVWLPLNANRIGNLLWAFVMGLLVDMFSNTPGENAAALTMAAFVQWPLLRAMAPKDSIEDMVPSFKTMGWWNHVRYVVLLTLLHHAAFYLLDNFSFFSPVQTLMAFGASLLFTLVMSFTMESLRNGK